MNAALRILTWLIALALVALPVVAVVNGWIGADRWPLSTLRVQGELARVDAAQLQAAVLPHARRGFFAVRLEDAKQAVEKLPWVERAEVRKWVRLFDQEVVVPMTMGFRATTGRPMFEPRMTVVSPEAGAELFALADEKWRMFDAYLGASNHIALGRFTFADLIMFAFANFGFTVGWKLPEGTDNLARFVETHNQRPCAAIWTQAE